MLTENEKRRCYLTKAVHSLNILYEGLKMKKNTIAGLALALLLVEPTTIIAESFWVTGNTSRILTEAHRYGQCMISIPHSARAGCKANWISLDCEGKFSAGNTGDRMLNVALVAQNKNTKVAVYINSTKKHDGYCVAERVDMLK